MIDLITTKLGKLRVWLWYIVKTDLNSYSLIYEIFYFVTQITLGEYFAVKGDTFKLKN